MRSAHVACQIKNEQKAKARQRQQQQRQQQQQQKTARERSLTAQAATRRPAVLPTLPK